MSDAQFVSEFSNACSHHIPRFIGCKIPTLMRSILGRASDESGTKTERTRCPQVIVMGSTQHHVLWRQTEQLAGAEIGLLSGLKWRNKSEPKIMSQGRPACLAMFSKSETLPFDSGPILKQPLDEAER
jgi:hypothetical protein